MKDFLKQFVLDAAPSIKAAFIKAAKVGAYIVLSAGIEAALAFVSNKPFDPVTAAAINMVLASLKKAVDEFGKDS